MSVWYNENDPLKAEVIREAIKAGAIAPGDVDERSIADVQPGDLAGYTQCHFFAGGGFWSAALRLAGWPDDWPVWTGSCPCPSFSAAGKGGGFDDPRHLWPAWEKLVSKRKPPVIFGEQADDAVGYGWLDLVQTDLEAQAYAVGKIVFGACSVGAPHIRQRLYFVADTAGERHDRRQAGEPGIDHQAAKRIGSKFESERSCDAGSSANTTEARRAAERQHGSRLPLLPARSEQRSDSGHGSHTDGGESGDGDLQRSRELGLLAQDCGVSGGPNSMHPKRRPQLFDGSDGRDGQDSGRTQAFGEPGTCGEVRISDNPQRPRPRLEGHFADVRDWRGPGWLDPQQARSAAEAGATRGFWADCDWWYGTDGKYRAIGPGLQPLAHGSRARVGRLRLYGDAICLTQAQAFIQSYLETGRL